jgi:hypothetical protein
MSEEEDFPGETQSDISFAKRQKELRSIYRDFRRVLSKYEVLPPSVENSTGLPEPANSYEDDLSGTSKLRLTYEVRGIIRELQSMRVETLELKAMISKVKTRKKTEVQSVLSKFDGVLRVLSQQIERAELLLDI